MNNYYPLTVPAHQVLVVEDDRDIREGLMELLEDHGYAVVGAIHGRDALEKLCRPELRPSLIVLDLMMPVMDGATFRRQQLLDPRLSVIPVVVISAHGNVVRRAAELRPANQLDKPLDLDHFLAVVREHCPSPATP